MNCLSKIDQDTENFLRGKKEWSVKSANNFDKSLKRRYEAVKRGLSNIYQKNAYMGSVKIHGL